ncbi:MAG: alpha/beta hydrolase [Raineya sp.]|jgi:predicted alpha/beta-fold hydrolase|nr:alpha/beta hydrolase [Raineya sp.]
MKKTLITIIAFIYCLASWGQTSLYDYLKLGKFKVGFTDTIILDKTLQYNAFGYNGTKPYFVQVWYPLKQISKKDSFLYFKDFYSVTKTSIFKSVQEQSKKHHQEIIIRDCISENAETGNPNQFDGYTFEDIFNLIGNMQTRSVLKPVSKKSDYPVIVYHHGSQSNSFENFAMAEYFASKGFIFVSANFHLPYENISYGLRPFSQIVKNEEEKSLNTILEFAKSLSKSSTVFFVGHSFGAQMGFRTLDQNKNISGMVSLETTIEFKKDYEKIKELWSEVFQKVVQEKALYPFPILLCAATGKKGAFDFFKILNAKKITYVSTIEQFNHNAYTSIFHLRYFLDSKIPQPDKALLEKSLKIYVKHLETISVFFDEVLKKKSNKGEEMLFIDAQ